MFLANQAAESAARARTLSESMQLLQQRNRDLENEKAQLHAELLKVFYFFFFSLFYFCLSLF